MGTMHSPSDPAFWFHHAQVDRIWHLWQQNPENKEKMSTPSDTKLEPWGEEFTIESVNDISNLDDDSYEYVEPASEEQ